MALRLIGSAWKTKLNGTSERNDHRVFINPRQRIAPATPEGSFSRPTLTWQTMAAAVNEYGSHLLKSGLASAPFAQMLDDGTRYTVHIRFNIESSYTGAGKSWGPLAWWGDNFGYGGVGYDAAYHKFYVECYGSDGDYVLASIYTIASDVGFVGSHDAVIIIDRSQGGGTKFYLDGVRQDDGTWYNWDFSTVTFEPTVDDQPESMQLQGRDDGTYKVHVAYARLIEDYEASADDLATNFKNYEGLEWFAPLNGCMSWYERCNVTRHVVEYELRKECEREDSGSAAAAMLTLELLNNAGQFSDDQYATFNPAADAFNGTADEKFLQRRVGVWFETFNGRDSQLAFDGRIDPAGFARDTQNHRSGRATVTAEDFVRELSDATLTHPVALNINKATGGSYPDPYFCKPADEDNSLVHKMARLGSRRLVKNFLPNSWFEVTAGSPMVAWTNVTQTGSYGGYAKAGGQAILLTAGAGEGWTEVRFSGLRKLNIGERYWLSCWVKPATTPGGTLTLKVAERDSGGENASEVTVYTTIDGWHPVKIEIVITDATSDRIRCGWTATGQHVVVDAVCLSPSPWGEFFPIQNVNLGTTGYIVADDYAEDGFDDLGFEADAVTSITHPWPVCPDREPVWDQMKQIADGLVAYRLGVVDGALYLRTPFKDSYADPTPLETLSAAAGIATKIEEKPFNRIVVRGVIHRKDTLYREVWSARATLGDTDLDSDWQAPEVWPNTTDYPTGIWCKYKDVSLGGPRNPAWRKGYAPEPVRRPGTDRITVNEKDEQIVGVQAQPQVFTDVGGDGSEGYGPHGGGGSIIDWTTRADACRLQIASNDTSAGTLPLRDVMLRSMLVTRRSGSLGYVNDAMVDEESVAREGARELEIANNHIVSQAQCDKIADYWWKDSHPRKHLYEVPIHGERMYLEPGEWYTLDLGAAGQPENILSVVRMLAVTVRGRPGSPGETMYRCREVVEDWSKQIQATARIQDLGLLVRTGNEIIVASSVAGGGIDATLYCDGTADQIELLAACQRVSGSVGGRVYLTHGSFILDDTLAVPDNVTIVGQGNSILRSSETADVTRKLLTLGPGARIENCQIDARYTKGIDLDTLARLSGCKIVGGGQEWGWIVRESADLSSTVTLDGGFCKLTDTLAVVMRMSSTILEARCVDISGGSISLGSWVTIYSGTIYQVEYKNTVARMSDTSFVGVYIKDSDGDFYARAGTVSGITITRGAEVTVGTQPSAANGRIRVYSFDSTYCLIWWTYSSAAYYRCYSLSGATLIYQTQVTVEAASRCLNADTVVYSATKALLLYAIGDYGPPYTRIVTNSSGTLSITAAVQYANTRWFQEAVEGILLDATTRRTIFTAYGGVNDTKLYRPKVNDSGGVESESRVQLGPPPFETGAYTDLTLQHINRLTELVATKHDAETMMYSLLCVDLGALAVEGVLAPFGYDVAQGRSTSNNCLLMGTDVMLMRACWYTGSAQELRVVRLQRVKRRIVTALGDGARIENCEVSCAEGLGAEVGILAAASDVIVSGNLVTGDAALAPVGIGVVMAGRGCVNANNRAVGCDFGFSEAWNVVSGGNVGYDNGNLVTTPHAEAGFMWRAKYKKGVLAADFANATVTIDTTGPLVGLRSTRIIMTAGGSIATVAMPYAITLVAAGQEWRLRGAVYVPSSGGPVAAEVSVAIQFYYSAAWNDGPVYTLTAQNAWEQFDIRGVSPAGTSRVRLQVRIASTASSGEYVRTAGFKLRRTVEENYYLAQRLEMAALG